VNVVYLTDQEHPPVFTWIVIISTMLVADYADQDDFTRNFGSDECAECTSMSRKCFEYSVLRDFLLGRDRIQRISKASSAPAISAEWNRFKVQQLTKKAALAKQNATRSTASNHPQGSGTGRVGFSPQLRRKGKRSIVTFRNQNQVHLIS